MSKTTQKRLLAIALILVVSALGFHAMVHWHEQSFDEQHCQVCQTSHVAAPLPVAQLTLQAPLPIARVALTAKSVFQLEPVFEHHSPRAPPV